MTPDLPQELRTCPFCGKQPLIVCPDNSYGSALITCGDDNECPVDLTAWGDLKTGETLETAIAAWNTRTPAVATDGQDTGVPASPSGYSAEPEPSCTVSAVPVSICQPSARAVLHRLGALARGEN